MPTHPPTYSMPNNTALYTFYEAALYPLVQLSTALSKLEQAYISDMQAITSSVQTIHDSGFKGSNYRLFDDMSTQIYQWVAERMTTEIKVPSSDKPHPGNHTSNLTSVMNMLNDYIHRLHSTTYSYEYTDGWQLLGLDSHFLWIDSRCLDQIAYDNHTSKDYVRYLMQECSYTDISHVLHIGSGGIQQVIDEFQHGWPHDSDDIKGQFNDALKRWADEISNCDVALQDLSATIIPDIARAGTSQSNLAVITTNIFNNPLFGNINSTSYTDVYNMVLHDYDIQKQDGNVPVVGMSQVKLNGSGKTAVLVTLPGTVPSALTQVNGPGPALTADGDGHITYTDDVEKALKAYLAQNNLPADTPIILSGHSLGGMVSEQVIEDMGQNGFNIHELITYGSPYIYDTQQTQFAPSMPRNIVRQMFGHVDDYVIRGTDGINSSAAFGDANYIHYITPGNIIRDPHDYSNDDYLNQHYVDFTRPTNNQVTYYNVFSDPKHPFEQYRDNVVS